MNNCQSYSHMLSLKQEFGTLSEREKKLFQAGIDLAVGVTDNWLSVGEDKDAGLDHVYRHSFDEFEEGVNGGGIMEQIPKMIKVLFEEEDEKNEDVVSETKEIMEKLGWILKPSTAKGRDGGTYENAYFRIYKMINGRERLIPFILENHHITGRSKEGYLSTPKKTDMEIIYSHQKKEEFYAILNYYGFKPFGRSTERKYIDLNVFNKKELTEFLTIMDKMDVIKEYIGV
jgi:hypothetical protein